MNATRHTPDLVTASDNDRDLDAGKLAGAGVSTVGTNPLSPVVITLMRGVIDQLAQPQLWQQLMLQQAQVRDYVAVLGLELYIDATEGHAFLRSRGLRDGEAATDEAVDPDEEDGVLTQAGPGSQVGGRPKRESTALPRLIPRRPLSFPVSLLLVLLRKKMVEADARGYADSSGQASSRAYGITESHGRLILSRDEIIQMIKVFLPAGSNEARLVDQIDAHINRVIDMGFARRLQGQDNRIEVRRLLKAFVDAQWLADFDHRLTSYLAYAGLQANPPAALASTPTPSSEAPQ